MRIYQAIRGYEGSISMGLGLVTAYGFAVAGQSQNPALLEPATRIMMAAVIAVMGLGFLEILRRELWP